MKKEALVKNAASEKQVRQAGHKENIREKEDKSDLQSVLNTVEGRRFLWRLLEQCKVFQSIWEPSARIHYLAGKHDFGLWLLSEIEKADKEGFIGILKERD